MLFACKVCKEKDARLADLKNQIAYLRSLCTPTNADAPAVALEADGILSGQQHIIEIPDPSERHAAQEADEALDEQSERDRILSGTY